jgi:hypothetical protein
MRLCLIALVSIAAAFGASHFGVVKFGGMPVPGVTVTATQGATRVHTITDPRGLYTLTDIADGTWTVQLDMQLFESERREISVGPEALPAEWELKAVPPSIIAQPAPGAGFQRAAVTARKDTPQQPAATNDSPHPDPSAMAEGAQRAADGFLINGSMTNGAASRFAQLPAFGNNRRGPRSLYNGNLGVLLNNSLLDARAFSLTGQDTPKPAYSRLQALFAFGGPLRIPHLIERNGPLFTINYQWTRNTDATTQTGRVPTLAERSGDLSGSASAIDPTTGAPFVGNQIPEHRISPQSRALLDLFPLPNFPGSSNYNYQVPLVSGFHQDDLQARGNKQVRRNSYSVDFAAQSTRADSTDLFGFLDTRRVTGINAGSRYRRNLNSRTFVGAAYQLSRLDTRITPYFANRRNVSAEAGITGNNQDPVNWGPPALRFSTGISPLTQPQASLLRNQTLSASVDAFFSRGRHNVMLGFTRRNQQFNVLYQQDARGSFAFTGNAAGQDFAGFLLGIPDTISIAHGNADKYLRATVNEAFVNDDFRVKPGLTINAGLRWEYWSPVTEKYGRLVNLDVAAGFTAATPVIARDGQSQAFPHPDRNNISPRIAFSWRPFAASSTILRGGYGIYYDTSIYQSIAMQMAQQAPLSQSLRIANSATNPLTLANAFSSGVSGGDTPTFAVDPFFRTGYSHNWQFSVQRDFPAALQVTAAYSGAKGTRAQQTILPNTFPEFAIDPSGFTYLTSNGNSIRHAGQLQLRRRLRSGLTASVQYTWSKSIDNAALGGRNETGALIAQNWLDLRGERALSDFDQRHLLSAMVQYTTGMGVRGGTLVNGWRGALLKEWTFGTEIKAGSGLPLSPVHLTPVSGTGITGSIRPNYTGAPLDNAPPGLFLNPYAYAAPVGTWGSAGRNSITGPRQFVVNASLGRTFRSTERVTLDLRLDAANALNSVTYTGWNTVFGSPLFGLPVAANSMRTVQLALRTRF